MLTRAGCWPWPTKPLHHWQVAGFVLYRWKTIVSSDNDRSTGWRKILHLPWRNVSSNVFFFFLRAIGYLMTEKTYKVAIRDAGAYFYKRLVSKNAKLKDLAHIFYYHLTRFPYFWRDGSRAKRIVELIEWLCFDRSKRTRHVLFSLSFYLYSLISLIFFPSPQTIPLVLIFLTRTIASIP